MDLQCRARAGVPEMQMKELQRRYERADRGIQLLDWAAYDAGLMVGYNEDSSWKPGLNWMEGCEDEYYAARLPDEEEED